MCDKYFQNKKLTMKLCLGEGRGQSPSPRVSLDDYEMCGRCNRNCLVSSPRRRRLHCADVWSHYTILKRNDHYTAGFTGRAYSFLTSRSVRTLGRGRRRRRISLEIVINVNNDCRGRAGRWLIPDCQSTVTGGNALPRASRRRRRTR